MDNNEPLFIKASHDVIKENGIEAVKRWSADPNPAIAKMFKRCLEAAGGVER